MASVSSPAASGGRAAALTSVFERLATQTREIAALAAEDDEALHARAEEVTAWSVAQQLEHLHLTGSKLLDAVEAILADPATPPRGRPNPSGWLVLLTGRIPRGRVKSRPEWSPEDSSPERARRVTSLAGRIAALEAKSAELAAARATRPHPVLGQFTVARWLRFLVIHQEHHLRMAREIRAARGLPPTPNGAQG